MSSYNNYIIVVVVIKIISYLVRNLHTSKTITHLETWNESNPLWWYEWLVSSNVRKIETQIFFGFLANTKCKTSSEFMMWLCILFFKSLSIELDTKINLSSCHFYQTIDKIFHSHNRSTLFLLLFTLCKCSCMHWRFKESRLR